MFFSNRHKLLFISPVFAAFFVVSCGKKCYDCVINSSGGPVKDTINTLCTDDPVYTSGYLNSWKIMCNTAGGESYVRDK